MNPREFCSMPGYSTALFLTYDFDPIFFERVVLRELWAGGTGDIVVIADPSRIAASLPRWSHGLVHLGRSYQLVSATVTGAFHPKIIIRAGREDVIAWVGSGNVTFGGWGGNLELSAAWTLGDDDAVWIGSMIEQIGIWCPRGTVHDVPNRIRNLPSVASLISSEGAVSAPVLLSRAGDPLGSQLARQWNGRRFEEAWILTGSTDRDGAFLKWLNDVFGVERATVAVDPGRASFDPETFDSLPIDVQLMKAASDRPLHAKLCWLSGLNGDAALMGSANCSRSAWLRDPMDGGNIEVVTVYDQMPPELVEEVSGVFKEGEAYVLDPTEVKEESEPPGDGLRFGLTEINWEPQDSELRIRFVDELSTGTHVTVDLDGKTAECHPAPSDLSTWVAIVTLEETARTRFAVVTVVSAESGQKKTQKHWINNHDELIHAAHGRQIENVLDGMRRSPLPADQRRILRELHRIGTVLLTEPQAFTDPLRTPIARREKHHAEAATDVSPVDPKTLIRSLAEVPTKHSPNIRGQFVGRSLYGVMRALFPAKPQMIRDEAVIDDGSSSTSIPHPSDQRKEPISELTQKRLSRQMEQWLDNFRDPAFAERCSARQLVQAAAYPLAVGILGTQHGWVSGRDAVTWVRHIFDTLLQIAPPASAGSRGILCGVHKRFRSEGKEEIFLEVVGDGTLWLALLGSFSIREWSTEKVAFERALALRDVFNEGFLLSSADNDRVANLIGLAGWCSETLLTEAVRVTDALSQLEEDLESQFDKLIHSQQEAEQMHEPDDLLWRPQAGWAVAQEKAAISTAATLKVYLRLRARVVKVRAAGFYINVTRARAFRTRLRELVANSPLC